MITMPSKNTTLVVGIVMIFFVLGDYIITSGGPIVTFRSDNLVWEFKDLSVREIQPFPNP
jgi:hypothetical protein